MGTGPGPNGTRIATFATSVFMADKKEDLDCDFSPFDRNGVKRRLIPELWDSLTEGEITEFSLIKN